MPNRTISQPFVEWLFWLGILEKPKNVVIVTIFTATYYFLFQIIGIIFSLLNYFICDIFKYAVLANKNNYKI